MISFRTNKNGCRLLFQNIPATIFIFFPHNQKVAQGAKRRPPWWLMAAASINQPAQRYISRNYSRRYAKRAVFPRRTIGRACSRPKWRTRAFCIWPPLSKIRHVGGTRLCEMLIRNVFSLPLMWFDTVYTYIISSESIFEREYWVWALSMNSEMRMYTIIGLNFNICEQVGCVFCAMRAFLVRLCSSVFNIAKRE